jgi:hypothetical protein
MEALAYFLYDSLAIMFPCPSLLCQRTFGLFSDIIFPFHKAAIIIHGDAFIAAE